jgi:hypothetical protein
VLPQGPLTRRRSRRKERFVGNHRNGHRANGLRGESVGVRHVDLQVGELPWKPPRRRLLEETIETHRVR